MTDTDTQKKFSLPITEDGGRLYVAITPDMRPKFSLKELKSNMLETGVGNMRLARIVEIVERATGEPEDIGPVFTYFDRRKEEAIRVTIADDESEARVEVMDWDKPEITQDDIRFCLYKAGVVVGINEEKLNELVEGRVIGFASVVAEALPPVDGIDAKIEQRVEVTDKPQPRILPDGSVDLKSYDTLIPVEQDSLLAIKIPATEGTAGSTVEGRVILANPGKDVRFSKGKGTYVSEDGLELHSATDGSVMKDGRGNLYVEKTFVVRGNLGYSTGNVDSAGEVKVKGDVLAGFSVLADGDIVIHGIVEGSRVVSRNGSVMVKGGIHGQQREAYIEAKETVVARFVQQAVIAAGDSVMVSGHILDSVVKAKNTVDVSSKQGQVLNSDVQAGKAIIVRNMGGEKSQGVRAYIGDPKMSISKVNSRIQELADVIVKKVEELDNREAMIDKVLSSPVSAGAAELKIKGQVMMMVDLYIQQREAEAEQADLRGQLRELYQGQITIIDTVHSGCVVSIAGITDTVRESLSSVVFCLNEGELTSKPYETT